MGISKMGFYYEQEGFYYNQPKGFYYNNQKNQGFYYNQLKQQEGFYYDQGFYYNQDQGFYYDQQQEGFYYEGFYYNQPQGFYYDQQDGEHAKFNKENKDYWYKGEGRERVVKALNGLRTSVDDYVTKKPHPANEIQGQALSNVVTIQVVREFFKNGGNEESLATLLAKECQGILSPAKDYRAAWQEEGSEAKKAMDQVTNEIVPFMVSWQAKQPFHKPNDVQDAACMKVVAGRLCEEAFYEWATKNDSKSISSDPEKQAKQAASIAKTVTDAVVGLLNKEVLPQSAE